MSGFDDLLAPRPAPAAVPGRGGSAADFGRAPVPGKDTHSRRIGEAWVANGSPCDDRDGEPGCFLNEGQRRRLVSLIERNYVVNATNYKLALQAVQIAEEKRRDDLPWLAALALEVAGGFLLKELTRATMKAHMQAKTMVGQLITEANIAGDYEPLALRVEEGLRSISTKRIEHSVKWAFDGGKRALAQGRSAAQQTEKHAAMSLLDQLELHVDRQYSAFCYNALAQSTDAELMVLWDQSDPTAHSKPAYEAELRAKLARFRKSGVEDLGRHFEDDKTSNALPYEEVRRDRRVVWVHHMSGVRELWYQTQDGERGSPAIVQPGDPLSNEAVPGHQFGPPHARNQPQLERRVPDEFAAVALERSEQLWGATPVVEPPEVTIRKEIAGRRGWIPELVDSIVEK